MSVVRGPLLSVIAPEGLIAINGRHHQVEVAAGMHILRRGVILSVHDEDEEMHDSAVKVVAAAGMFSAEVGPGNIDSRLNGPIL